MTPSKPLGGSVFLVEDELMIRMMVGEMLKDLGYTVVAEAGELDQAVELARSAHFDVAILDVNVNGQVITPVVREIEARQLPYILATGYDIHGIPEEFRNRPALQKPFQMDALAEIVKAAIGSAAASPSAPN